MASTVFPQLQFTPFTYMDKEVFRVARPYQLLCAYAEINPTSPISIQFTQSAHDIGKSLVRVDSDECDDEEKLEILTRTRCVLSTILSVKHEELIIDNSPPNEVEKLIELAEFTLRTANDPYKLGTTSGSAKTIISIDDSRTIAKN